jgi:predicted dehydrogenase
MSKKIKIAVIGGGRIAYSHLCAIKELNDKTELVATVDKIKEIAKKNAEEFGAKYFYTSMDKALDNPEIDAVVICLPHYLHAAACKKAIEKRKHILIEKPLTITYKSAKEVVNLATQKKVNLMVGQSQRFTNIALESKRIFESGEIGNIIDIVVSLLGYVKTPPTAWWASEKKTGGLLIPLWGSHIIDYILWLSGKTTQRVYAETLSVNDNWEGEDEASIIMGFNDGAMASIIMSYNAHTSQTEAEGYILPIPKYSRYIIGTKGTLHIIDDELFLNDRKVEIKEQEQSIFKLQMNEFIDSILEKREPSTTGKEAMEVIKIMEASRISSKKHKLIRFDNNN